MTETVQTPAPDGVRRALGRSVFFIAATFCVASVFAFKTEPLTVQRISVPAAATIDALPELASEGDRFMISNPRSIAAAKSQYLDLRAQAIGDARLEKALALFDEAALTLQISSDEDTRETASIQYFAAFLALEDAAEAARRPSRAL
jgi:hypothetical protein